MNEGRILLALMDEWEENGKSEEEIADLAIAYRYEHSLYHQWLQRPKPVKFWSYEGGEWSDITDEVIAEEVWLTFEEMIASTTAIADDEDMDYVLKKYILHDEMYPLYRLDPNTNDITVWVDHAHLEKITDKVASEEGAGEDREISYELVMAGNYGESTKRLVEFIYGTKFRTYTLVFDAKTGTFSRKK
jgi:hypothetical protein